MKDQTMTVTVALLSFQNLFGLINSISCGQNSIGIDWTGSSSDASGSTSSEASWQSAYSTDDCEQDVCSVASYDIDFTLVVEDFLGFSWWDWTWDGSFSIDGAFCGDTNICQVMAGGDDSCKAINFDFQQWYPTTCRDAYDYDATTIDFNITYKYGCCTTDDCNEDYDYSSCEFNTEFGNYVGDLYECWNGVRKDVMTYLVCDDEGELVYDFQGNCRAQGVWLDGDDCTYIHECTDDFRTVLTNFGECACTSASDNDYSGIVIAEIMETQWNTYCPNINLTCSAEDGSLELWITRWYLYWSFNFAADATDALRESIRSAIAEAANVDVELVIIYNEKTYIYSENDDDDDDGTTITISIITETEDDADTIKSSLYSNADAKVYESTGVNTTNGTAEVDETTEEFNGAMLQNVISALMTVVVVVSLVVAIGF